MRVASVTIVDSKPCFDISKEVPIADDILDKLRKTDYMSKTLRDNFPDIQHELISAVDVPDKDPNIGMSHRRIGYFYLPSGQPVVFTIAFISIEKVKPELIQDSINKLKPLGDLFRDHYPHSIIKSQPVPGYANGELIDLPHAFMPATTKRKVCRRERYIMVDDEIKARIVEFV